ncbi:hypothetical protein WICMUC_003590 [Wickerhamomyces mucosus]|uniref:[histone H3]-trimethyl-L-lysine(9) demethylase n=1 Tax=Wickerhamomyces mucosus TaxID=1378264 RepID=A0A9P8TBP3_9ASCO|nr:hypothetical protein WICMUC_003590 [Wickerhamomyces mucosus]
MSKPSDILNGVPIFKPTMDEFKDFEKYMKLINPWGMESGIVKIIPPIEWINSLPKISNDKLKSIKIKNPIEQNMGIGKDGVYSQQNIEKQKTYNIVQWKALSEMSNHQPPAPRGQPRLGTFDPQKLKTIENKNKEILKTKDLKSLNLLFENFDYNIDISEFTSDRCQNLENQYWKHLSYADPLYGADMTGSLFDDSVKYWNLQKLPNVLDHLNKNIPGVNDAYLYAGLWKATFSWHLEDQDLYSINYLHFGAPKQWYSIPQSDRLKFEKIMQEEFPQDYKKCKDFLRHKTFLMSPNHLNKKNIQVNKMVHYPGEFMITYPYGYHAGMNYGYNLAEAVNFAIDYWFDIGLKTSRCLCIPDSVGIDVIKLQKRYLDGKSKDIEFPQNSEIIILSDQEDDLTQDIKSSTKRKRQSLISSSSSQSPKLNTNEKLIKSKKSSNSTSKTKERRPINHIDNSKIQIVSQPSNIDDVNQIDPKLNDNDNNNNNDNEINDDNDSNDNDNEDNKDNDNMDNDQLDGKIIEFSDNDLDEDLLIVEETRLSDKYTQCRLCPTTLPNKQLRYYDFNLIVTNEFVESFCHRLCALTSNADSIQENVHDGLPYVDLTVCDRSTKQCEYCTSKKGSTFKCSSKFCSKYFHATCALPSGVYFKSYNQHYCPKHRPPIRNRNNVKFIDELVIGELIQVKMDEKIVSGAIKNIDKLKEIVVIEIYPVGLTQEIKEVQFSKIINQNSMKFIRFNDSFDEYGNHQVDIPDSVVELGSPEINNEFILDDVELHVESDLIDKNGRILRKEYEKQKNLENVDSKKSSISGSPISDNSSTIDETSLQKNQSENRNDEEHHHNVQKDHEHHHHHHNENDTDHHSHMNLEESEVDERSEIGIETPKKYEQLNETNSNDNQGLINAQSNKDDANNKLPKEQIYETIESEEELSENNVVLENEFDGEKSKRNSYYQEDVSKFDQQESSEKDTKIQGILESDSESIEEISVEEVEDKEPSEYHQGNQHCYENHHEQNQIDQYHQLNQNNLNNVQNNFQDHHEQSLQIWRPANGSAYPSWNISQSNITGITENAHYTSVSSRYYSAYPSAYGRNNVEQLPVQQYIEIDLGDEEYNEGEPISRELKITGSSASLTNNQEIHQDNSFKIVEIEDEADSEIPKIDEPQGSQNNKNNFMTKLQAAEEIVEINNVLEPESLQITENDSIDKEVTSITEDFTQSKCAKNGIELEHTAENDLANQSLENESIHNVKGSSSPVESHLQVKDNSDSVSTEDAVYESNVPLGRTEDTITHGSLAEIISNGENTSLDKQLETEEGTIQQIEENIAFHESDSLNKQAEANLFTNFTNANEISESSECSESLTVSDQDLHTASETIKFKDGLSGTIDGTLNLVANPNNNESTDLVNDIDTNDKDLKHRVTEKEIETDSTHIENADLATMSSVRILEPSAIASNGKDKSITTEENIIANESDNFSASETTLTHSALPDINSSANTLEKGPESTELDIAKPTKSISTQGELEEHVNSIEA